MKTMLLPALLLGAMIDSSSAIENQLTNETRPAMTRDINQTEADADAGYTALASGQFSQAITLFNAVIKRIGDDYQSPQSIDDSGMKLVLANREAQNGNLKAAAALKQSVVQARLAMMRNKRPK